MNHQSPRILSTTRMAAKRRKSPPNLRNRSRRKTKTNLREVILPVPISPIKTNRNPTRKSNRPVNSNHAPRPRATKKSAAIVLGTECEMTMPERIVEIETEIITGVLRKTGTDELVTAASRNERVEPDLDPRNATEVREEAATIVTIATGETETILGANGIEIEIDAPTIFETWTDASGTMAIPTQTIGVRAWEAEDPHSECSAGEATFQTVIQILADRAPTTIRGEVTLVHTVVAIEVLLLAAAALEAFTALPAAIQVRAVGTTEAPRTAVEGHRHLWTIILPVVIIHLPAFVIVIEEVQEETGIDVNCQKNQL